MADTIREKIIAARANRLSVMRKTNGYNYDCGENVFRAAKQMPEGLSASAALWPGIETAEQRYGKQELTFKLRIEAAAQFDPKVDNSDAVASQIQNALLGDIIQCMTDPEAVYADSVPDHTVIYTTGGPASMPGEEDTMVAAFAEFELKYSTVIGDPYSEGLV